MKKFLTVAAIGALIAVSGCGKSENAAASGPVKREAGNWKTDVKLVKFEVPGMPAEMKDGMAKMMEGASGMDQCFTQEQVDKEDIASELAKGPGNGGEWHVRPLKAEHDEADGERDEAGSDPVAGGEGAPRRGLRARRPARRVPLGAGTSRGRQRRRAIHVLHHALVVAPFFA